MVADLVDGVMDGFQHAEPEEIEFDETSASCVVFVPLDDGAVLHSCPFDGDDVGNGAVTDHHSARVDAQVAGLPAELLGKGGYIVGGVVEATHPCVDTAGRIPQSAGCIAEGTPSSVCNDISHLSSVFSAIFVIAILDNFFPTARLNVQINIRRAFPFRAEEALEEKIGGNGIHIGNSKGKAHRRVSRRTSPLRQDIGPAAKVNQIRHDEEVPRKIQAPNHVELVINLRPRCVIILPRAITHSAALLHHVLEPGDFGISFRDRPIRKLRRNGGQREGTVTGNGKRVRRELRILGVEHFGPTAQICSADGVRVRLRILDVLPIPQRCFRPS